MTAPGDTLELRVEKGVYRGLGLARHEGQVVFIPRALPGDRVRVRVDSVTPGYIRGTTEALLERASERRPSPCPFVPRCGGCAYQELGYPAQLRLKESILRESLQRAGAAWEGEIGVEASPEEGWRTRASFHFEGAGAELRLGLREEGSRRVVDLAGCLQLSARMDGALRGVRKALEERPDLWRRVRGVEMAESVEGADLAAALETDLDPREAVRLGFLGEAAPALTGLAVWAGRSRERRLLSLRGSPHVRSTVLGLALRAHVGSFFQANRFLVDSLARAVVDLLPRGGVALDLYAGVGLFALPLAAAGADEVHAIEASGTAVEDASANARTARLGNVRVRRADVARALASLRASPGERIVLDPPRAGAGREVVRAVAARRPEAVVYVSCDPPTLGRDLAEFAREGLRPNLVRAFDLFPDTFHLETVVRLVPA